MWRTVAYFAVAVLGSALTSGTVAGQSRALPASSSSNATLLISTNEVLTASLDRIAAGSALWRQAMHALEASGRRALVLTPNQVAVRESESSSKTRAFDPTVLAEVVPVPDARGQVSLVVAVINLSLLEESHGAHRSVRRQFEADLDRILIHEIYGHALPYLLAGNLSGRCADPAPGERAADACSIRRENAVREELGLGRRMDYGLSDLFLTRHQSFWQR